MIVAKKFRWEAAHRIPWHQSKCKNLHGHSYKMIVAFEGTPDDRGFVIDFSDIKKIVAPYVSLIDHATIISEDDRELKELFESRSWKYFLLPYDSTVENLCKYFLNVIIEHNKALLVERNITSLGVKIFETATAYAYAKVAVMP
jgi:6-pyruvoyltetrahydropterin/6-carboxytetrahydropterin synthase